MRHAHPSRRLRGAVMLAMTLSAGTALAQSGNYCIVRTPALQGQYSGDCEGGVANGRGRASGTDRYEGNFRDGHPVGAGMYTFADGRRFDGEFVGGKANGRARLYFPNGDLLEGEFRENNLLGIGRLTRINGEVQSVQQQGSSLVVVNGAAPAPMPAPPPAPMPSMTPPPPPAPGVRPPEPQQCGDRLRLEVLSLTRSGPGLLQMVVAYENLGNADVRLAVNHESYRRDATYVVDNSGETWQMLGPREGGTRGTDGLVFLAGGKTRVSFAFRRLTGGQDATSFILQNPLTVTLAHRGAGNQTTQCRFEVRNMPLFGNP